MKIERFDLDANGQQCSEGYYATDGRTVYLVPPTGELHPDGKYALRLATRAEVDAAREFVQAPAEYIANCDPCPSDRAGA